MNATDFHLYIDSADIAQIEACLPHPVIHGVTTNPTLLRRAGVARADVPGCCPAASSGAPARCRPRSIPPRRTACSKTRSTCCGTSTKASWW